MSEDLSMYVAPELMVSEEVKKERLIICIQCDKYTEQSICSECNCVVGMMTSYTFKSCPIGKWK